MRIRHLLAFASVLAMGFSSGAWALELEADTAHSGISFEIKHLVVSTVRGSFSDFSGLIDLNEKDTTQSKVSFTVKSKSISTSNAKRDDHLKGPDFFDVEKFPEAKFVSTSIKKDGTKKESKDKYKMEGDLTLHGVTKKALFNVQYFGKNKDPWGHEKYGFQASTELNRKDYGLIYNKTLETGGVMLGETVKLMVDIEAAAKASEAAK